ncbi:unnamed protein product [Paramecium sonneborni]|uniref:RNA ligase domain-containing protein n=1 Tax=Paramecium sonneborni TaxID=65129 RepID=A0A8S1M3V8_9CILI|nr:unnamed protein product [Paramecium sonneborni]
MKQNKQQKQKKARITKNLKPIINELQQFKANEPETQLSFQELENFLQTYNKFTHSQIQECKIQDKEFQIRDVRLKVHYEEDTLFALNNQIHQNFRRGLAYINYGEGWKILRKGQKKFFDLYFEDIQGKGDEFCQKINYYNVGRAEELAKQNKQIKIYVSEKANGENCQISYCKEMQSWSISSKNKTIVIGNENDLSAQCYQSNSYTVAQMIAKQWFKELKQIKQPLDNLQNILQDHTFIGEFCGHAQLQHLIRYDDVQIRFFSIVKKNSTQTCLSPQVSQQIFQNLNLKTVKFREIIANGIQDFKMKLLQLQNEISKQNLQEMGEGSVLYFCNSENDECLSLAKLKTIEYRIIRKIREKMKNLVYKNGNIQDSLKRFIQECEQFPYFSDPEFQKAYYIELCNKLLKFGNSNYLIIFSSLMQELKEEKIYKKVFFQIKQSFLDLLDLIKQDKPFDFILNHFITMKQNVLMDVGQLEENDDDEGDLE